MTKLRMKPTEDPNVSEIYIPDYSWPIKSEKCQCHGRPTIKETMNLGMPSGFFEDCTWCEISVNPQSTHVYIYEENHRTGEKMGEEFVISGRMLDALIIMLQRARRIEKLTDLKHMNRAKSEDKAKDGEISDNP